MLQFKAYGRLKLPAGDLSPEAQISIHRKHERRSQYTGNMKRRSQYTGNMKEEDGVNDSIKG
jgi:hypothetical protein